MMNTVASPKSDRTSPAVNFRAPAGNLFPGDIPMTERAPIETTNLRRTDQTTLDWNLIRDQLAAPPPPETPGSHIPSVLGTAGAD